MPRSLYRTAGRLDLKGWSRAELAGALQRLNRHLLDSVDDHLDDLAKRPSLVAKGFLIGAQSAVGLLHGVLGQGPEVPDLVDDHVQAKRKSSPSPVSLSARSVSHD